MLVTLRSPWGSGGGVDGGWCWLAVVIGCIGFWLGGLLAFGQAAGLIGMISRMHLYLRCVILFPSDCFGVMFAGKNGK